MNHGDYNIECSDYEQWKSILKEELVSAATFEIHCWNEETKWIELALQYGSKKESAWNFGTIIAGIVNPGFAKMILELPKPKDIDVYNKMTPFFSIFLDTGFSSEHYGIELTKIQFST